MDCFIAPLVAEQVLVGVAVSHWLLTKVNSFPLQHQTVTSLILGQGLGGGLFSTPLGGGAGNTTGLFNQQQQQQQQQQGLAGGLFSQQTTGLFAGIEYLNKMFTS